MDKNPDEKHGEFGEKVYRHDFGSLSESENLPDFGSSSLTDSWNLFKVLA